MGTDRSIVVYFDTEAQLEVVRQALGTNARYFAGLAEGEAGPDAIAKLISAGLTIDAGDPAGPGNRPTPELVTAIALQESAASGLGTMQAMDSERAIKARSLANRSFLRLDDTGVQGALEQYRTAPDRAPGARAGRTLTHLVGAAAGGVVSAAGLLVVLQQLGSVDPVVGTALVGLGIGAVGGFSLGMLRLVLGRG